MKDIKLRIKSVESTMQITKAMELVAPPAAAREGTGGDAALLTTACGLTTSRTNTDFSSPFVPSAVKKTAICDRATAGCRRLQYQPFKTVAAYGRQGGVRAAHRQSWNITTAGWSRDGRMPGRGRPWAIAFPSHSCGPKAFDREYTNPPATPASCPC
ncbi:MAG: hypothetical protein ACLR7U_02685 [Ruthenibacterium lactatiformans]